ncbi:MAG: ATP-binding cassette domain-containing protein [Oscillospiraceae bacterium]
MLYARIKKRLGKFTLDTELSCENEAVGILGASGSGKSMTLRCIAGIVKPDEGKIIADGVTLFDSEKGVNIPPRKRGVGLLFQNYALFPNMAVEQNIRVGMRGLSRAQQKREAAELIEQFRLGELARHTPAQLSGGQQQRCALARIFAAKPKLLLLDEPFSALDSHLRWQLEQEVSQIIAQFSGTTLLVSHNRDEVYRLCEKIAVTDNGICTGAREKAAVFEHPQTYAQALLTGCKNLSRARRLSDNTVYAVDWDLSLRVENVPENVKFVGIRAHRFQSAQALPVRNGFSCEILRRTEDTFSMIYLMQRAGETTDKPQPTQPLRWEAEKGGAAFSVGARVNVVIAEKDILLLS